MLHLDDSNSDAAEGLTRLLTIKISPLVRVGSLLSMLLSDCKLFSSLLLAATLISVFVFWSSLSGIPNQSPQEWTARANEHKTAVIGNVLPLVETTEPVPTNKDAR